MVNEDLTKELALRRCNDDKDRGKKARLVRSPSVEVTVHVLYSVERETAPTTALAPEYIVLVCGFIGLNFF